MSREANAAGVSGRLTVTIHKCTNLPDKQLIGTQEPYVKLECGSEHFKTHHKEGINPSFEQSFIFNLKGVEDIFHLHVYDKEVLADRSIGRADLRIREIVIKKGPHPYELVDNNNFAKKAGFILVTFDFGGQLPFGLQVSPSPSASSSSSSSSSSSVAPTVVVSTPTAASAPQYAPPQQPPYTPPPQQQPPYTPPPQQQPLYTPPPQQAPYAPPPQQAPYSAAPQQYAPPPQQAPYTPPPQQYAPPPQQYAPPPQQYAPPPQQYSPAPPPQQQYPPYTPPPQQYAPPPQQQYPPPVQQYPPPAQSYPQYGQAVPMYTPPVSDPYYPSSSSESGSGWTCVACTFVNYKGQKCDMCGLARPGY